MIGGVCYAGAECILLAMINSQNGAYMWTLTPFMRRLSLLSVLCHVICRHSIKSDDKRTVFKKSSPNSSLSKDIMLKIIVVEVEVLHTNTSQVKVFNPVKHDTSKIVRKLQFVKRC